MTLIHKLLNDKINDSFLLGLINLKFNSYSANTLIYVTHIKIFVYIIEYY